MDYIKIFTAIFCIVFLAGTVTAGLDFDNFKFYDEEKQEYLIKNAFGLGEEIARVTLDTPQHMNVIPSKNTLIAEITIENYADFDGAFDGMQFLNLRNDGKEMQRNYIWRVKEIKRTRTVFTSEYDFCADEEDVSTCVGKHPVSSKVIEDVVWKDLEDVNLKKGNYTLGLFIETYEGDYGDFIPELFGEKLNKWATWTASFDVDLQGYWAIEKETGDYIDLNGARINMTSNGTPVRGIPGGARGNFTTLDGVRQFLVNSTDFETLSGWAGDMPVGTINIWLNWTNTTSTVAQFVFGVYDPSIKSEIRIDIGSSQKIGVFAGSAGGNDWSFTTDDLIFATHNNSQWQMITLVHNGTEPVLYVNGTLMDITFAIANDKTVWFNDIFDDGGATHEIFFGRDGRSRLPAQDFNGSIDEFMIWNRTLTAGEITTLADNTFKPLGADPGTIGTTLLSPPNNLQSINTTHEFQVNSSVVGGSFLINQTIFIWNSDGSLFSDDTFVITGTASNVTSLNKSLGYNSFFWNALTAGDDGLGNIVNTWGDNNFSLNLTEIVEDSATFNATNFETALADFQTTSRHNESVTINPRLWYAGVRYTGATTSGSATAFVVNRTIDLPLTTNQVTNEWFFEYLVTNATGTRSANGTLRNQIVNNITLEICGDSVTTTPAYINISYKNETTAEERVNASVPGSTWVYWLGSGLINQTLSYSESTELAENAFCFSPINRTIGYTLSYSYKNLESQQRLFTVTGSALSNTTLDVTLFLLPTLQGLFTTYRTIDPTGVVIRDAFGIVRRTISGVPIDITSGFTDSAGQISFFLNPDASYDYTFSATGFVDNTFSLIPNSLETYTIIMGNILSGANGSTISSNLSYELLPSNSSLMNDTTYTFSLDVTGININATSLNITNASGFQVGFVSGTGAGLISVALNTGSNNTFLGYASISTAVETITFNKRWTIGEFYSGTYSIDRQFRLFLQYEFSEFIRFLMVILFIVGFMIYLTRQEVLDTSESKVIVVTLLVWIFSFVGWLDTGLATNTSSAQLTVFTGLANQYGIAILTSGAATYLLGRRLFE